MKKITWEEMIARFHALGGIAENVTQSDGIFGKGIFPIDKSKEVYISVPERLIFNADDYCLTNGHLQLSEKINVSSDVREFIRDYQHSFSWGSEGRLKTEIFEKNLQKIPTQILEKLKEFGYLDLEKRQTKNWDDVIRIRFLYARLINFNGRFVVMPVMELLNHSPKGRGYSITSNSIVFRGIFNDEVTVNYSSYSDPMRRFFTYGFACSENRAFSIPLKIKMPNGIIMQIRNNPVFKQGDEDHYFPEVKNNGLDVNVSHLLLGHESAPRLPKTHFRRIVSNINTSISVEQIDEVFERIRYKNNLVLLDMLNNIANKYSEDLGEFQKALLYQIKALSFCYGVRS